MNILLIVDKYIPYKGANEICIDKILDCWPEANIKFVARTEDKKQIINQPPNGVLVYHSKEKSFFERNIFSKVVYIFNHTIKAIFGKPYDNKLVSKFVHAAETLYSSESPDIIVSIMNPVAAVEAGFQLMGFYRNSRFLIYDLDTVSNCSLGFIENKFKFFYSRNVYKWEKKVYSKANLIVHLKQHQEHFNQTQYRQFNSKTIFEDLPLLNLSEDDKKEKKNKIPTLIYAGTFYNRLREPHKMVDLLVAAREKCIFKTKIFTNKPYVTQLNNELMVAADIHTQGFVSEEQISDEIENSDFLLSVGNSYSVMFPSKIVTYVSKRKPIIHIYTSSKDPVCDYLKMYPDVLLIDGNGPFEHNVKQLVSYLTDCHVNISAEEIRKIYYANLPEHNANSIMEKLLDT